MAGISKPTKFPATNDQINALLRGLATNTQLNPNEQWNTSAPLPENAAGGGSKPADNGFHASDLYTKPWHSLVDVLNFAERPLYGIGGALTEGLQKNVTSGGDVGQTLKAIAGGAAHGLEGKTHNDFGSLFQSAADAFAAAQEGKRPQDVQFKNKETGVKGDLANAGLTLPKWAKIAGVGLDVAGDPLNALTFGTISGATKAIPKAKLAEVAGVKVDADLANTMAAAGKTPQEIIDAHQAITDAGKKRMAAGETSTNKDVNYQQYLNTRADLLESMGLKDPYREAQNAIKDNVTAVPAVADDAVHRLVDNAEQVSNTHLATGAPLGDAADNATSALPKLPKHLATRSPKLGPYKLQFDDDVTKALYEVGGNAKTAQHEYLGFLKDHFGPDMSEAELKGMGRSVRATIAGTAPEAVDGVLRVKTNPGLFAKTAETVSQNVAKEVAAPVIAAAAPAAKHTAQSVLKDVAAKVEAEQKTFKPYESPILEGPAGNRKLTAGAVAALKAQHLKKTGLTEAMVQKIKELAGTPQAAQTVDKQSLLAEADKIAKERRVAGIRPLMAQAQKGSTGARAAVADIMAEAQKRLGVTAADKSAEQTLKELNQGLQKLLKDTHAAEVAKETKSATKAARIASKATKATEVVSKTEPTATDIAKAEQIAQHEIGVVRSGSHNSAKTFNKAKQKNIWNQVREYLTQVEVRPGVFKKVARLENSRSVFEKSLNMLTHATDHVIEAGGHPAIYLPTKQIPFRLDTLLRAGLEMGVPIETLVTDKYINNIVNAFGGNKAALASLSDVEQQVIRSLQTQALTDSLTKVTPAIEQADQMAKVAKLDGNPVEMQTVRAEIPKQIDKALQEANVEGAVAESAKQTVKDIVADLPTSPALKVAQASTEKLATAPLKMPDYKSIYVLRDNAEAVKKELRLVGLRGTDYYLIKTTKGMEVLSKMAERSPESIKKAFNNAHGMADIWPTIRGRQASAEAYAQKRVEDLQTIMSHPSLKTIDQQQEALKNFLVEDFSHEGAAQLQKYLDPYLGNRMALFNQAALGLEELNPFLRMEFGNKSPLIFTDEIKGSLGETIPATRDNMLQQLGKVDLQQLGHHINPLGELLYGVTTAVEKAHANALAFSDLAATLGTKRNVMGFMTVDHPRLQGVHFPPEIHKQLQRHIKLVDELSTNAAKRTEYGQMMAKGLAFHDALLRGWKKGVTRYTPGYYARNFMGDAWLSWVSGMTNPMRYTQAAKVLRHAGRVTDSPEFYDGSAIEALLKGEPDDFILKGTRLGNVDSSQMLQGYYRAGVAQNFGITEAFRTGVNSGRGLRRPFAGKVDNYMEQFQEATENFGRMPQFIHEVDKAIKGGAKNLDEAMQVAGAATRKTHFDYGDLTQFERKVMKRLVPFYTWTRKSVPFLLEHFMLEPWKMMVIPKMNYGIAQMLGQDPMNFAQPWPLSSDTILPSWMKDAMMAQWGGGETPFMGKIPDPMTDTSVGGPGAGMLNPFLKWPFELKTGQRISPNIPVGDKTRYIDSQIPIVSKIASTTNTSPVAGALESLLSNPKPGTGFTRTTDPNNPGGGSGVNIASLLSNLFGVNFAQDTKQRQLSAQLEQQKAKK